MSPRSALVACLLSVVVGCGDEPPQLVVELCTDIPPSEVVRVEATARDADAPTAMVHRAEWSADALRDGRLSFGVVGLDGRQVRVEVTLETARGSLTRVVETGFEAGRSIRAVLRLSETCIGRTCPASRSCDDRGLCAPIEVATSEWSDREGICALMDADAGMATDASFDGSQDGGGDATIEHDSGAEDAEVVDAGDAGTPDGDAMVDPCDRDGDGVPSIACGGTDCDDDDPDRFPGNPERCDDRDQDCDPCTVGDRDADLDGFISRACSNPAESATCEGSSELVVVSGVVRGLDCDDDDPLINPDAPEVCNGVDDDCDDIIDEGTDAQCTSGVCEAGCIGRRTLALSSESSVQGTGCAVAADGSVVCWGEEEASSVGHAHVFATLGARREPAPVLIASVSATEIAMAHRHACARLEDSTIRCWGSNARGQLGVGDFDVHTGVHAPLTPDVVQVAVGTAHSCALTRRGDVLCWGSNAFGELGLGDYEERSAPTRVPSLNRVVELVASAATTCARRFDGEVLCWGSLEIGGGRSNVPVHVTDGARALRLGGYGSFSESIFTGCAALDAGWHCWGTSQQGAAGTGVNRAPSVPTALTVATDLRAVAPHGDRSCGVLVSGAVRCWGHGNNAALGTNTPTSEIDGVDVPGIDDAIGITCGHALCCVERSAGPRICWGAPRSMVHGDGHTRDGRSPDPAVRAFAPTALTIGATHACAIRGDEVWCWGANTSSLGTGDLVERFEPEAISLGAVEIDTHVNRTCARTATGAVYCWGANYAGDTAETSNSRAPVLVDASLMGPATAIAVGSSFSCALDRDGAAWCWGSGSVGTCGNGGTTCRTPVLVGGDRSYDEIDAGNFHVCARSGGSVWCWGLATWGRLGNDETSGSFDVPVPVSNVPDAVQLSVGHETSCVRRSGGGVRCWGRGNGGQTGDGANLDRSVATDVASLADATRLRCNEGCFAYSTSRGWLAWGRNDGDWMGTGSTGTHREPVPAAHGLDFSNVTPGRSSACGVEADGVVRCWGGITSSSHRMLGYSVLSTQ